MTELDEARAFAHQHHADDLTDDQALDLYRHTAAGQATQLQHRLRDVATAIKTDWRELVIALILGGIILAALIIALFGSDA